MRNMNLVKSKIKNPQGSPIRYRTLDMDDENQHNTP